MLNEGIINEGRERLNNWLSHPNELGNKPYLIEYTNNLKCNIGEYCLIYKYKPTPSDNWLLAIDSSSGTFSQMKIYNEETELEDAELLFNFLKDYWKNKLKELEKQEAEKDKEEDEGLVGVLSFLFSVDNFEIEERIFYDFRKGEQIGFYDNRFKIININNKCVEIEAKIPKYSDIQKGHEIKNFKVDINDEIKFIETRTMPPFFL